MLLALNSLVVALGLRGATETPADLNNDGTASVASEQSRRTRESGAAAPAARRLGPRPTPLCYEVLVAYHDAASAARSGRPADFRHTVVFQVWASDVGAARQYARERFRDFRAGRRSARMTAEGPVPLRVVPAAEAFAASLS